MKVFFSKCNDFLHHSELAKDLMIDLDHVLMSKMFNNYNELMICMKLFESFVVKYESERISLTILSSFNAIYYY